MLIVVNVNSTMLGIKGDTKEAYKWPLPMHNLYFHFVLLLAFFYLMLVLRFSECLSPGYICLVVDMADGCVLWGFCTCTSEVSAFLGRTQKKITQNSQSDFRYGQ